MSKRKIQFTDKWLASKPAPGWWSDRELKGFAVRVNDQNDGHSFYVRRRIEGRLITRKLEVPINIATKEAREAALLAIVKLQNITPARRSKSDRFGDLLKNWIAGNGRKGTPKPRTQKQYRGVIAKNVPQAMLDGPVPTQDALTRLHFDITKRLQSEVHTSGHRKGEAKSQQVADLVAKIINGTLRKHYPDRRIDTDLFMDPPKKRKAVWKLERWIEALRAMPEGRERDALIFATGTGLRHSNIMYRGADTGLRWDQINFDSRTLDASTKSRDLVLPLADGMLEIINRQPRYTEFVFPFWEARTEEMFEAGVWFHDTREYFGTIAAKAGLRKYVYDLLRGDAAGTIAEQYLTPDELHEQAQRVNDLLFELLHSAVQN